MEPKQLDIFSDIKCVHVHEVSCRELSLYEKNPHQLELNLFPEQAPKQVKPGQLDLFPAAEYQAPTNEKVIIDVDTLQSWKNGFWTKLKNPIF